MAYVTNTSIKELQNQCRGPLCGRPPRYKLNTITQYLDGKDWKCYSESNDKLTGNEIRRVQFGHISKDKKQRSILMVGETGTGKTTLINTIVNYILGVKYDDNIWFEITDENPTDQAVSQTSAITLYEIYRDEFPFAVTIIDTPGYGDTERATRDKDISRNLFTLFTCYNGTQALHSIGLVVKASMNRLTVHQRYIFESVLSMFGENLKNNIVVLVTHSDGGKPVNALNAIKKADIPTAKTAKGAPVLFKFNNCQSVENEEKDDDDDDDDCGDSFNLSWQRGDKSLESFFEFVDNCEGQSLMMTADVLLNRIQLEACVVNLQQQILIEDKILQKLQQTEQALQDNKDKLDNNKNFTFEVDETTKELVHLKNLNTKEEATRCNKCKETCHFPGCTWVSKDKLWLCSVMKNEKCTVCTNRCSYKDHVKEPYIYVPVTKKVQKQYENLLKEYKEKYGADVNMLAKVKEEMNQSQIKKKNLVSQAYNNIMDLQKIALLKDALSVLIYLDLLIEKLVDVGLHEEAEKLQKLKPKTLPESSILKTLRSLF